MFHTCSPASDSEQDHLPQLTVDQTQINHLSPLQLKTKLLEGATADMNGAIQLLTGASQNPKLSDADITVLSKVAAEMHSANSIIRSQLHLVQQQDFSGVSQQGPPPVPSWMSTFLQSDSRTIAPACSNGSLQTPLASHLTQSDAAALGGTPLVQVTQALPQHTVYTQSSQLCSARPQGCHQQASPVQSKQLPSPGHRSYPQSAVRQQTTQPLSAGRHSYHQPAACRSDNCVTSWSCDYMTGAECDGHSLSTPCDRYSSHAQRVSFQQPASSYAQPMSWARQLSAMQSLANQEPRAYQSWQQKQLASNELTSTANKSSPGPAYTTSVWPPPGQMAQPQHDVNSPVDSQDCVNHQPAQPASVSNPAYHPTMPASPASPRCPAAQPQAAYQESALLPARMHLTSSPVLRPSRFNDYMPSAVFDASSLSLLCDPYNGHAQDVSPQQPTECYARSWASELYAQQCLTNQVPYQHYHQPYNALNDQCTQQYTTQHMAPVLSSAETSVFVSDGICWNEVNLEKVSPDRFLAKNLPAGGHNWEYDCPLVV